MIWSRAAKYIFAIYGHRTTPLCFWFLGNISVCALLEAQPSRGESKSSLSLHSWQIWIHPDSSLTSHYSHGSRNVGLSDGMSKQNVWTVMQPHDFVGGQTWTVAGSIVEYFEKCQHCKCENSGIPYFQFDQNFTHTVLYLGWSLPTEASQAVELHALASSFCHTRPRQSAPNLQTRNRR